MQQKGGRLSHVSRKTVRLAGVMALWILTVTNWDPTCPGSGGDISHNMPLLMNLQMSFQHSKLRLYTKCDLLLRILHKR